MTDSVDKRIIEADPRDWAEWEAYRIVHISLAELESNLAQALREARAQGLEEAAKLAENFAINKTQLHPDVTWENTSDTAKEVAHVSAQLIAIDIRKLKNQ